MRKAVVIVVVAVALAVAAGCGTSGDQPAASVNDVVITDNDVLTELRAIAGNEQYASLFDSNGVKISGATKGSFDPNFAAQVLARQMNYELVRQEVDRRGLVISDDCRAKAKNDALVNLGSGTASDGEPLFNAFPAAYQDMVVTRTAILLALQNDLAHQVCGSPDAAQAYYTNHPDQFAQTCLSLISVGDEATANDLANRVRAGEDFATLAQQYSTDDQSKASGGDLGCEVPSQLPTTLADAVVDAKAGDVVGPFTTALGPTIFLVRSKDVVPLDQVEQQADELADRDLVTGFNDWLKGAQQAADITVDRRYGTLDRNAFVITPPAAAAPTTTTVAPTAADTPAP